MDLLKKKETEILFAEMARLLNFTVEEYREIIKDPVMRQLINIYQPESWFTLYEERFVATHNESGALLFMSLIDSTCQSKSTQKELLSLVIPSMKRLSSSVPDTHPITAIHSHFSTMLCCFMENPVGEDMSLEAETLVVEAVKEFDIISLLSSMTRLFQNEYTLEHVPQRLVKFRDVLFEPAKSSKEDQDEDDYWNTHDILNYNSHLYLRLLCCLQRLLSLLKDPLRVKDLLPLLDMNRETFKQATAFVTIPKIQKIMIGTYFHRDTFHRADEHRIWFFPTAKIYRYWIALELESLGETLSFVPCDSLDYKKERGQFAKDAKERGNEEYGAKEMLWAAGWYSVAICIAEKTDPNLVIYFSNRAQAWIQMKQWEKAKKDLKEALTLDPNHEKSLMRLQFVDSQLKTE